MIGKGLTQVLYVMDGDLRAQDNEPQMVGRRPTQRDQVPVHVVQEEEPLQLRPRRLLNEPPVRRRLLISQKFHRHPADGSRPSPATNDLPEKPDAASRPCAR